MFGEHLGRNMIRTHMHQHICGGVDSNGSQIKADTYDLLAFKNRTNSNVSDRRLRWQELFNKTRA